MRSLGFALPTAGNFIGVVIMSSMKEIEMQKHRKALYKDILSLVNKYLRAIE
jgi:hypothetical protein